MSDHKHNAKYSLGATEESYDLENPTAPESFEITYNGKEKSNNSLIPSQPTKSQKARRYLGKNYPLLWGSHEPILTIGPDCKKHYKNIRCLNMIIRALFPLHVEHIDYYRNCHDCLHYN